MMLNMNYLNIAISIKVKVNFNILDNSVSITQYVLASVCHRHVSYTVRSCDLFSDHTLNFDQFGFIQSAVMILPLYG